MRAPSSGTRRDPAELRELCAGLAHELPGQPALLGRRGHAPVSGPRRAVRDGGFHVSPETAPEGAEPERLVSAGLAGHRGGRQGRRFPTTVSQSGCPRCGRIAGGERPRHVGLLLRELTEHGVRERERSHGRSTRRPFFLITKHSGALVVTEIGPQSATDEARLGGPCGRETKAGPQSIAGGVSSVTVTCALHESLAPTGSVACSDTEVVPSA